MSDRIAGASVWDQRLFDRLRSHVESERGLVEAYEGLADASSSAGFGYLAKLIVEDERRHHGQLADLAEAVRSHAELRAEDSPIPLLGGRLDDDERARIIELTEEFLRIEEQDKRELAALRKELKPVQETTLWSLLVELMEADTDKHIRILRFIRDRARRPLV